MADSAQTLSEIFALSWRALRPWMRWYVIVVPTFWVAGFVWMLVDVRWSHEALDNADLIDLGRSAAVWIGFGFMQWSIAVGTATSEGLKFDYHARLVKGHRWLTAGQAAAVAPLPASPPHGIEVVIQPMLAGAGAALFGIAGFLQLLVWLHYQSIDVPRWKHPGVEAALYLSLGTPALLLGGGAAVSSIRRVFMWSQAQAAREAKARAELQRAQLSAAQAAVEPKLLFWALGYVSSLSESDPAAAERVVEKLSIVLRHALTRSQHPLSTVADEIAFTQEYVAVEQERLGNRLHVSYAVDESTTALRISTRCLQAVVEEAIRQSGGPDSAGAVLTIGTALDRRWIRLYVERIGPITSADEKDADNGLRQLRQQLEAQYGFRAGVEIFREPDRIRTTVNVPVGAVS